jgi:hypothetical protein
MGITAEQACAICEGWNEVMESRITALKKAAIFYRIVNYLGKVSSGIFAVIMIGLDSVLVGGFSSKSITIALLVFQCCQVFLLTSDSIVGPASKSALCSQSAKMYEQLVREINVRKDEYRNMPADFPDDHHVFDIMNFSAREQHIIESEPLLIMFGTRGKKELPV